MSDLGFGGNTSENAGLYPDGYEYGIEHSHFPANSESPHRWGMSQEQAEEWINSAVADGFKVDAFRVIRRRVSSWEAVDGEICA